jgi:hypothetical protein
VAGAAERERGLKPYSSAGTGNEYGCHVCLLGRLVSL